MLRLGSALALALLVGCGGGARRINSDLRAGPRSGEAEGFQFTCTYGPGASSAPPGIRRLCESRRRERVSARRTEDGGLRIRIRFTDARGQRLELYLYRSGGQILRGAVLVQRRGGGDPVEIEPDEGWIAVDHLDVRGKAASGRYALSFGRVRVGGSFVVNRQTSSPGPEPEPRRTTGPRRARRPQEPGQSPSRAP